MLVPDLIPSIRPIRITIFRAWTVVVLIQPKTRIGSSFKLLLLGILDGK